MSKDKDPNGEDVLEQTRHLESKSDSVSPDLEVGEQDENTPDELALFWSVLSEFLVKRAPDLLIEISERFNNEKNLARLFEGLSATIMDNGMDIDISEVLYLMKEAGLWEAEEDQGVQDVDVLMPVSAESKSPEQIMQETRENIYRSQLVEACREILQPEKLKLLQSTNPDPIGREERGISFEVALHNIAVIWVGEALYAKMDKSSVDAAASKAAKKRAENALMDQAKEDSKKYLAERGMVDPTA